MEIFLLVPMIIAISAHSVITSNNAIATDVVNCLMTCTIIIISIVTSACVSSFIIVATSSAIAIVPSSLTFYHVLMLFKITGIKIIINSNINIRIIIFNAYSIDFIIININNAPTTSIICTIDEHTNIPNPISKTDVTSNFVAVIIVIITNEFFIDALIISVAIYNSNITKIINY